MYTDVSADYIAAVRSDCRCWKSRLVFGSFVLYNIDSVSYTNGSQSGNGITVGSVTAPTIKITLNAMDDMPELTGRDLTWELGILTDIDSFNGENQPEDFEYAPVAQFHINKVKRNGVKFELECCHKLSQSDIPCDPALEFPTTAEILLASCCNTLGLTLRTRGLVPQIPIESVPAGATVRQVMGWCAALYGGFITADRADGVLLRWYGQDEYNVPLNAIAAPEIGETDVAYTAVRCIADDKTFTTGEGRAMVFECPFMTPSRFTAVAEMLRGFSYRPCKLKYLLADPLIDPWDTASLTYEGVTYAVPCAGITLDAKGGLSGSVEAKSGEVTEQHTDPITKAVNRLAKKIIEQGMSEIEQDIADAVREAAESIRGGASGFFHIVTDENGVNKETIWCDNIDPYAATHGIRINANGIGFWRKSDEPDKNIFNGTYTQAWTINGDLIADFIRAGTLQGITIICQQGSIGGWEITESSIVSPDGSVSLESTYYTPLTTHDDIRDREHTHADLRELTHRQIRYLRKQKNGKAQITASNENETIYLKDARLICERDGRVSFRASSGGIDLYDTSSGEIIGSIGQNKQTDDKQGLVFDLESAGEYMAWAVREKPNSRNYTMIFWYDREDDGFKVGRDLTVQRSLTVNKKLNAASADIKRLDIISDTDVHTGPIRERDGLGFFDKQGNYMGGIHADKRPADVAVYSQRNELRGLTLGAPKDIDFVGLWQEDYGGRNYETTPILAWYRNQSAGIASDCLFAGRQLWSHEGFYIHGSSEYGSNRVLRLAISKQGYDIYNDTSGESNDLIGGFRPVYGRFKGIQTFLRDGDFIRWSYGGNGSAQTIMQYTVSDDTVDVYRDLDMHSNSLLNANIESSSDERLKANIRPCEVDCLEVIKALGLIEFDWKDGKRHEDIGFSAQQAGKVRRDLQGDHGGYLTVNEGRLIRYLVGAVQQLAKEVEVLRNGT